jgi:hypothetical protein
LRARPFAQAALKHREVPVVERHGSPRTSTSPGPASGRTISSRRIASMPG